MYYAQLINKKGKYFAEIVKVSRGVKTKLSSTRLAAGVTGGRLSFALSGVQLNLTLDGVSVGAAADTGLLGGGGVGLLGSAGATFDNVTVIGGF